MNKNHIIKILIFSCFLLTSFFTPAISQNNTQSFTKSIALKGIAGNKALVAFDNSQPQFISIGQSINGVNLINVLNNTAEFKAGQEKFTLKIGDNRNSTINTTPAPQQISGAQSAPNASAVPTNLSATSNRVVVNASDGGSHYVTDGFYDGKPVKFILDTGASMVSMGIDDAIRLGINYAEGKEVFAETAGGRVPSYLIKAPSVTVGSITIRDVDTIVASSSFGKGKTMLLGQSFLSKVRLIQEQGQMILESK